MSVPPQTLSLALRDDNRIELRLGNFTVLSDAYYLGLDARGPDHECDPAEGVARLIRSWIKELIRPDRDVIYLPFGFSDEFTRWVRAESDGDDIVLSVGWAKVEGWAFNPSDFSEYVESVPEFVPDEEISPARLYRPRCLSCLRRSLGAAKRLAASTRTLTADAIESRPADP